VPRLVLAVLLLLVATAWAGEDDERLLETPPAQGMPERMQELEREWAEDVGTKDPDVEPAEPEPLDEAHDAARGAEEAPDPDVPTLPQPDEPPVAKKRSPVLESPIQRTTPEPPTVRGTPPPVPKEGAAETPAKPAASRPPTNPEE
jgi:hypothetical protein